MPVSFVAEPDPVEAGVVASLASPGGNVTGLSDLHADSSPNGFSSSRKLSRLYRV